MAAPRINDTGQRKIKCIVCGNKELPLFRFPKQIEKCEIWLSYLFNHTGVKTEKDAAYLSKYWKICKHHFEDWCFSSSERRRLIFGAVPFKKVADRTPDMDSRLDTPVTPDMDSRLDTPVTPDMDSRLDTPDMDLSLNCISPNRRKIKTASLNKNLIVTPKSKRIKHLTEQLSKMKRKALRNVSRYNKTTILKYLQNSLTTSTYQFVLSQLKASSRKPNGRCWTVKDKSFYLNIYFQSPATYKMLSKLMPLPCRNTLLKSITGFVKYPGFCLKLLSILKQITPKLSVLDTFCTLVVDELSIKSGLRYDSKLDMVMGYANYGPTFSRNVNTKDLAKHALVFMIRGIRKQWKQLIGYFLTSNSLQSSIFKSLVTEAIDLLTDAGLKVICIVCDQSPTNQALYKELHVSQKCPYFQHNQQKVYALYDPPHLLKSVRNNLKKYNVLYENEKFAKWLHIQTLYEIDSKNKYRVAPHLSKSHIEATKFASMNVKLAAQTFSHSVAAGLCLLSTLGHISPDACFTADFVGQMDELFDSFNSRTLTNPKKMACAVSETSGHVEMWKRKLEWINSWHFVRFDGKTVKTACKNGWILSINAILQIWETLKFHGYDFLLTNRLNQDCLENTFSVIRNKGGFRANPDCSQFLSSFRTIIIHNLIKPSQLTNCESDSDHLLTDIFKNSLCIPSVFTDDDEVSEIAAVSLQLCQEIHNINLIEENAMNYFAGYLANKVIKTMGNCSECENLLTATNYMDANNTLLLFFKKYDNCGDQGGLKYPSKNLETVINQFTSIFFFIVESHISKENIKKFIYCQLNKVETNWLNMHTEHNIKDCLINLYIKVMLYYYIQKINKEYSTTNYKQKLKNVSNK